MGCLGCVCVLGVFVVGGVFFVDVFGEMGWVVWYLWLWLLVWFGVGFFVFGRFVFEMRVGLRCWFGGVVDYVLGICEFGCCVCFVLS